MHAYRQVEKLVTQEVPVTVDRVVISEHAIPVERVVKDETPVYVDKASNLSCRRALLLNR